MNLKQIEQQSLRRSKTAERPEKFQLGIFSGSTSPPLIRRRPPGPPRGSQQKLTFHHQLWLITGAANGIGRAWATYLMDNGAAVIGFDLANPLWEDHPDADLPLTSQSFTASVASQFPVISIDLADLSSIPLAVAALERLIIQRNPPKPMTAVAHIAGIQKTGYWSDLSNQPGAIDKIMRVNAYGPIAFTEALEAAGLIAPHTPLLGLASLSCFTGYPFAAPYAASKDVLASWIHLRDQKQDAHSLVVYPGPVRTHHAAAHAPRNTDRDVARRMAPEKLAELMGKAWLSGKRDYIPGVAANTMARLAQLAPNLFMHLMAKRLKP